MVTHNIEEALQLADRVIILDSDPGRLKAEVQVILKHPRDTGSPAFRQLVERVYTTMTTPSVSGAPELVKAGAVHIAHRLPGAQVAQIAGVLEQIAQPAHGGSCDLPVLAEATQMEVDDLFPILEALELLDFAVVSGRRISLARHGQAFLEADIQRRKVIFAEHLLKRVPLASHIRRVLDERPLQHAPESRFLRELEDYLTEDEAQRVLSVIIDPLCGAVHLTTTPGCSALRTWAEPAEAG